MLNRVWDCSATETRWAAHRYSLELPWRSRLDKYPESSQGDNQEITLIPEKEHNLREKGHNSRKLKGTINSKKISENV